MLNSETKKPLSVDSGFLLCGVPTGIRTPVASVKGRCPRPLDDGDIEVNIILSNTANLKSKLALNSVIL